MNTDEKYMREALRQAGKAAAIDEVPIGCVIVRDDKIIARGYNRRNTDGNTLAHAEITAIRKACRLTGDWRLEDCTLYVTLEPGPMCSGVILNARLGRVVYGATDEQYGCLGSRLNLAHLDLGAAPRLTAGVLAEECSALLSAFFRGQRQCGE